MSSKLSLNQLKKEISLLDETYSECRKIFDSRKYREMSLKELSKFYDKIQDGLISFNLILNNTSEIYNKFGVDLKQDADLAGKFLESQLLYVALSMVIKDPLQRIPQQFKESPLCLKIKDKEYYNELFVLTGIDIKYNKSIYNFLQK